MKFLVQGSCEFLIQARFEPNRNEKGDIDYSDIETKKATGVRKVEHAEFFAQIDEGHGYGSNKFLKVYLSKDDILRLAEEIKKVESELVVSVPGYDDLPF